MISSLSCAPAPHLLRQFPNLPHLPLLFPAPQALAYIPYIALEPLPALCVSYSPALHTAPLCLMTAYGADIFPGDCLPSLPLGTMGGRGHLY